MLRAARREGARLLSQAEPHGPTASRGRASRFAREEGPLPVVTEEDVARLPEPVARHLRYAGVVDKPYVRTVRLRQEGRFWVESMKRWMPLCAEEYFNVELPGFTWVALLKAGPLVNLEVIDRFDGRHGSLEARIAGLIPVAKVSGPETDRGELVRFLSEMVFFPSSLAGLSLRAKREGSPEGIGGPTLSWRQTAPDAAWATLEVAGVRAEGEFVFDREGAFVTFRAPRPRLLPGGGFSVDAWETPCDAAVPFPSVGLRLPWRGLGMWKLPGGDLTYAEIRLTDIEYHVRAPYATALTEHGAVAPLWSTVPDAARPAPRHSAH